MSNNTMSEANTVAAPAGPEVAGTDIAVTQAAAQPQSKSLAFIRQRLHGASTHDFTKAARVHHASLDVTFCVVPMKREDYEQYRNLRAFEEIQHADAGRDKTSVPVDRVKSDLFLLSHAVYSEEGEALTAEDAKALMDGAGLWPGTKAVLGAAEKENPPRENLAFEVQLLWRKNQAEIAVWEVLFECGLGRALLDWFAPSATPEEQERARHNIAKAEEAVHGFAAFFQAKEAAKILGMNLKDAVNSE